MKIENEFYPQYIEEWFDWLKNNHRTENVVWLLMYKKNSNKPTISYDDAVNVALCFGWVEVIIKRKDDFSYYRVFKKRINRSSWSELNKKRANMLIESGLMQEPGFAAINQAKENGEWDKDNSVYIDEKSEIIFINILKENPEAFNKFNLLSNTQQKHFLRWISNAKREETKLKRINKAINMIVENKKFTG